MTLPGSLSAERWERLEPVLDAALSLGPAQREAFLREACAGDDATLRELVALVAECERDAEHLARAAAGRSAEDAVALDTLRAVLHDRYDVLEVLGQGGMATVYRAHDRKHDRPVAIKVLRPTLAATIGGDRFLREIAIVARLSHPQVLPLHDSGAEGGVLYHVSPLVEGGTLRDRLRAGERLDVAEAVGIAAEICAALDYAHRQGVVHRDVKPENVLLHEGRVLLADFGIARALGDVGASSRTPASTSLGTPTYMSPEQATGDARLDGRADLYAVGCVLYEMLAGAPPYVGPTAAAVMAQQVTAPVPSVRVANPAVPEPVDAVMRRTLAKRPDDRPQSGAALAAMLRAAMEGGRRDARVAEPARRRWRTAALAAAVVALVVVVAAMVSWRRMPAQSRALGLTLLTRGQPALVARRIVVAPFENRTGDSTLAPFGELASAWLTRELVEANFEVVDARSAAMAWRIVERLPSVLRPSDPAIALAEETHAGIVLSGRYYREGDSLLVQAMLTHLDGTHDTQVIGPVGVLRGNDAPRALRALAARATATVAGVVDSSAGAPTTALTEPPSIEAFQHASRGWEMFFMHPDDTAAAFAELARALELDSTYAAPRLMRAYMVDAKENWPELARDVAALQRRRATLGRAERWGLELFEADVRGDGEGRLHAARELAQLSGGAADMQLLVAVSAVYVRRFDEVIAALDRSDPNRGINLVTPMYWAYRSMSEHALGRYDDEERTAREEGRRFPEALDSYEARARVAARRGDVAAVRATIADARAHLEEESWAEVALRAGRELRVHGRAAEAGRLAAELDRPDLPAQYRAVALYEAGRWDAARRALAALVRTAPDDTQLIGRIGVASVHLGDAAAADSVVRLLERWHAPFPLGAPTVWRARIAAARQRPAEAVALYRQALREGWRAQELGMVGVHEDPELAALASDPGVRAFLAPRSRPPASP